MRIALSPEAMADLERLREFPVEKDPRVAARASETLVEAFDSLMSAGDRLAGKGNAYTVAGIAMARAFVKTNASSSAGISCKGAR